MVMIVVRRTLCSSEDRAGCDDRGRRRQLRVDAVPSLDLILVPVVDRTVVIASTTHVVIVQTIAIIHKVIVVDAIQVVRMVMAIRGLVGRR